MPEEKDLEITHLAVGVKCPTCKGKGDIRYDGMKGRCQECRGDKVALRYVDAKDPQIRNLLIGMMAPSSTLEVDNVKERLLRRRVDGSDKRG